MRHPLLLLSLLCLLAPRLARADTPGAPPAASVPVSKPAPVTEQELPGEWGRGTFTDNEWLITFRPDHTAAAVLYGYVRGPQIPATWALAGDTLTVQTSDGKLLRPFGTLRVVRYKHSVVLLPQPMPLSPRTPDYNPLGCFWRIIIDRKRGELLPADAADFMRGWQYPLATVKPSR